MPSVAAHAACAAFAARRSSTACEHPFTHTHPPPAPSDPNLLDTLAAYDGTPGFLRGLALDSDALTKAVIGTMGDIDAYQLPDAKGYAQFSR